MLRIIELSKEQNSCLAKMIVTLMDYVALCDHRAKTTKVVELKSTKFYKRPRKVIKLIPNREGIYKVNDRTARLIAFEMDKYIIIRKNGLKAEQALEENETKDYTEELETIDMFISTRNAFWQGDTGFEHEILKKL